MCLKQMCFKILANCQAVTVCPSLTCLSVLFHSLSTHLPTTPPSGQLLSPASNYQSGQYLNPSCSLTRCQIVLHVRTRLSSFHLPTDLPLPTPAWISPASPVLPLTWISSASPALPLAWISPASPALPLAWISSASPALPLAWISSASPALPLAWISPASPALPLAWISSASPAEPPRLDLVSPPA